MFENYLANNIWSHNTGLGKTPIQLVWAQHAADRTLILAPLAVAQQTVREGEKFGIPVTYARRDEDAPATGIAITNYEMMSHFDANRYGAVVLDESSILKSFDGKMRTALIQQFASVPQRLCCTATPAPNDITEIANHAEFLGIMTRVEMLAAFFVHDSDTGWRLKGHARAPFFRWLASWGMSIRKPSDIGPYSDDAYDLPGLDIQPHFIETDYTPEDRLFAVGLKGITDRCQVRKATINDRCQAAVKLIQHDPGEPWLIWCGLNDEQDTLARLLGNECVSIHGSLSPEEKVVREAAWRTGLVQTLITKPSVMGWGMNWQHCARMAFVGLSDSFEAYYQCLRRCYRYGQTRPVQAHIILTDREEDIYANVLRKEREAADLATDLIANVREFERAELHAPSARQTYTPTRELTLPEWVNKESPAL